MLRTITNNFAVATLIGVALAWIYPPAFTWLTDGNIRVAGQPLLSVALAAIMLAMGLTLNFADYARLRTMPRALIAGVALQFLIMPFAGAAIAWAVGLQGALAAGLILVACCPGGTASNVVAYLARGNVALSVAMTMTSTLLAVALTPLLTGELAGAYVEIDRWNLLRNMLAIVLLPVIAGTVLNTLFPQAARKVSSILPLIAILLVVLIVGAIIGGSKDLIREHAGQLVLATFMLHVIGFGLGYVIARLLGFGSAERRAISIEVGMQNSGLGSALAKTDGFQAQFADPLQAALAPVPSAISSVWHVIIGSVLAGYWRRRDDGGLSKNAER